MPCPDGSQDPNWCPRTPDEFLSAILGSLPRGPAWDGAEIAGTVQHSFWRSFAVVLAHTYARLCAYVDEFFCATVNESRDQWIEEYGLNDTCDPYGNNLCVKVAAEGGATCDYFVEMARLSGVVIECEDASLIPEPIAGCFEVGCTPLGPTPVFARFGGTIGYGEIGTCQYGEVVQHPDPDSWEQSKASAAACMVPGSNLGHGPDDGEACCFICGWYDFSPPTILAPDDFCAVGYHTIYFDCPRRNVESNLAPAASFRRVLAGMDANKNYSEWGHAHVWGVTVNLPASESEFASQPLSDQDTQTSPQAGNYMVGGSVGLPDGTGACGTPLCADGTNSPHHQNFVLCFLDRIKPAHTVLNVKVIGA